MTRDEYKQRVKQYWTYLCNCSNAEQPTIVDRLLTKIIDLGAPNEPDFDYVAAAEEALNELGKERPNL